MEMSHGLTNTGQQPITTTVYNHNFLVLDRAAPGPDFEISFPFAVTSDRPPDAAAATISGNTARYMKRLENHERVAFPVQGIAAAAKDHSFRIDNTRLGVGMTVTGDRPAARIQLWSIRSVLAIEPFIDIAIEPGKSFEWQTVYSYHQTAGR